MSSSGLPYKGLLSLEMYDSDEEEERFEFFPSQISAMDKTIHNMAQGIKRHVLVAQMQSGKAHTYRLIACEALRLGRCSNFMIISGVPNIDLRNQTRNPEEIRLFLKMYRNYLQTLLEYDELTARRFIDRMNLAHRLKENVFFGSAEIKKLKALEDRTLIIHDESHYAQGVKHTIADFFTKMHLEYPNLEENARGACYLGVSATPFTQLSAMAHESVESTPDTELVQEANKEKFNGEIIGAVNMKPGPGYFGVREMKRDGLIRYVNKDNLLQVYNEQLASNTDRKWVIVRCANAVMIESMKRQAVRAGYAIETFDQKSDFTMSMFKSRPLRKTVVFIKDFLRLGMNLPKKFISFTMDTAFNAKIDSTEQGLAGRLCGYDNPGNIPVFISDKLIEEMDKFIQLTEGSTIDAFSISKKATGMMADPKLSRKRKHAENGSGFHNIIPIELPWNDEYKDTSRARACQEAKRHCLRNAVASGTWKKNFNNAAQTGEIRAIVAETDNFSFRDLTTTTAKGLFEKLVDHADRQAVMNPGSIFGFHGDKNDEVNVFFHPVEKRAFFICQTNEDSTDSIRGKIHSKIARSTGKDIFNAPSA